MVKKEQPDAQPVQICRDCLLRQQKGTSSDIPPMPEIARIKSLKVLGVTISSRLSLSEHVNNVISSCARSLYAIKVLRAHGLCAAAFQQICRSVVVAKLLYASPVCLSSRPTNKWNHFYAAVYDPDCTRHS